MTARDLADLILSLPPAEQSLPATVVFEHDDWEVQGVRICDGSDHQHYPDGFIAIEGTRGPRIRRLGEPRSPFGEEFDGGADNAK